MIRTRLLPLVVAAVALGALSGCTATSTTPSAGSTSGASADGSSRARIVNPTVVTIGDSIMKGHGLFPSQAWPTLLARQHGWKLDNLACDGAGFLTTGDDSDCAATFSGLVDETVDLNPRTVIVEGSSNDYGEDDGRLIKVTESLISELHSALPHTQIIGLSTVWGDTAVPAQLAHVNEQVAIAVKKVGGTYVSIGQPLAGHPEWMQSDDVHPTGRGQQAILEAVQAAFAKAHITA